MKKRLEYNTFIGLVALMNIIIIAVDLIYKLHNNILENFNYINLIISSIFFIDFLVRVIKVDYKIIFITKNFIDILSILPIIFIPRLISIINLTKIDDILLIKIFKIFIIISLLIKFKNNVKVLVLLNQFNYMLVLTTVIIVLGAMLISLLENMSFSDAIWWSFVTFTTVGYGDILLTTTLGKVVGAFIMILGIGFVGVLTSSITIYIINSEFKNKRKDFRYNTIELIKRKIDNLDSLSDYDLEIIYNTLKALKQKR